MEIQDEEYSLNQKVKISGELPWAKGQTGVISRAPPEVLEISEGWINDCCRRIQTPRGEVLFYWIKFDSAQFNDAGEGPFAEAEIATRYLEIQKD